MQQSRDRWIGRCSGWVIVKQVTTLNAEMDGVANFILAKGVRIVRCQTEGEV